MGLGVSVLLVVLRYFRCGLELGLVYVGVFGCGLGLEVGFRGWVFCVWFILDWFDLE